ncbi:MAG: outer membrane beta-barrel protein [Rikenellaceae bacterium]
MRHFLLSLLLTVVIASVAVAQPRRKPATRVIYGVTQTSSMQESYEDYFSVRIGANFADLIDPHYTSNSQTGFNAALLYNISLADQMPIYLQTGLSVEMKGARSSTVLENVRRSHLKSYWLEVPVVVTFDMPISTHTALVPEFGVYYAYAFQGSLEGDGEFYRPYDKQEIEIEDEGTINSRLFRRSDFGLRMGISMRYDNLLFGFAYDAGLLNTFSKDIRDLGTQLTTGCWSLNMQMRFR